MSKFAILCVDDATVLASLRVELGQILDDNYRIETAEGAEEALTRFRAIQADRYEVALVLADYPLLGPRGDDLLQQLHAYSPQTLHILVSDQAQLEGISHLIQTANLIQPKLYCPIVKPWQPSLLRSTVLAAIQSYQHNRHLTAQNETLQQTVQQLQQTIGTLGQSEAQLRQQAQQQAEALAQLNQFRDDFLESISHELRAPISNIRMATQMLEVRLRQLESDELASQCDRYLQILRTECQREVELLNDLLDLMRLDSDTEPLNLSTVQIDGWLPHVAEPFVERMQAREQQLVIDLPANLPSLTTDLSHLERSLTELLTNAWKYTPVGETITITAQTLPTPAADATLATTAAAQPRLPTPPVVSTLPQLIVGISINNTGVEIPVEEHARIFDQFYRIAHHNFWQQSSTGLGLAIVKKRVEKLHGAIDVTSRPVSTTFTIKLPLHPLERNVSLEKVSQ